MAEVLKLPTFTDTRGSLTVIEKLLPFQVQRIYYLYNITNERGGHRHKVTKQALICLGGSCEIYVHDGEEEIFFLLDSNDKCLIIEPEDWHTMKNFSEGAILLVLASEYYDAEDYIDQKYI